MLALVLWITEAADAQQRVEAPPPEVVLVPHRASYEMKLSVARPNSGIVEVNGNMVLETADSCDGWNVKQRIKLTFLRNDGEEFVTDSNFTSYESKDGLELRFSVRNVQNDEVEEELRGQADLEGIGGKGRASFTLPEARSFDLPAGTLFPTQHMQSLIQAGRAGERIVTNYVFDGSGPDALNKVTAVLGQGHTAKAEDGVDEQRWPVSLAYYGVGKADELPQFSLGFELSERGVLHDITLDYGEFALKGELEKLEPLGEPQCQ